MLLPRVLLTFALWSLVTSTADFSVDDYCSYLQSNPEPDVLLYNRIPKTGSSSVESDLMEAAHRRGSTSMLLDLNRTNMHESYHIHAKDVAALVGHLTKLSPHVAVAGHIPHPDITAADWGGRRMEFMNTMRSCVDQTMSAILFVFLSSGPAKARSASEQEAFLQAATKGLPNSKGSDYAACFNDPACSNAYLDRNNPMDSWCDDGAYICGETRHYAASDHACVAEKLFTGMNPTGRNSGYTTIGLTENMNDSLELLQCAFPSYFAGAETKRLNVNKKREEFSALKAAIAARCAEADVLYSIAETRFFQLLAHIRRPDGAKCCRSKKSAEDVKSTPRDSPDHAASRRLRRSP